MKLSLYAFMVCLTIANIAYGMEDREPSPITIEELEQLIQKSDARKGAKPAPVITTLKEKNDHNTSNTKTSQQVCMKVLRNLAEKRLTYATSK
jgi:hypothetical protein